MNNDPVNKPAHYTDGKIEVIDFIEDKKLNFNLGNAVKYISRAGKKNPYKHIEDLEKAAWYLNREIKTLDKDKFPFPEFILFRNTEIIAVGTTKECEHIRDKNKSVFEWLDKHYSEEMYEHFVSDKRGVIYKKKQQ